WQSRYELGINREVVALNMTGSARAPIATELFFQEKLAPLRHQPGEMRLGIGIETVRRIPFTYESDFPVEETIEGGAGTCEHERLQWALARSHHECTIRKETGAESVDSCDRQGM